jgi:hypothetical protein
MLKIESWFRFIFILVFIAGAVYLSIHFYPEKSLFFKLASQPPAAIDFFLKQGESWLAFLDRLIPFFPSFVRIWWRRTDFIQFFLTLPLIFLLSLSAIKVKPKIAGWVIFIFLICFLPAVAIF